MLRIIVLLLFNCFLIYSSQIRAETLKVASDFWCPYICDSQEKPGVLIEVLTEIATLNKMSIDFEVIPLTRSLLMTSHAQIDVVLAITENHAIEHNLKRSQEYFGGWQNDFYISKKNDWPLDNLDDIKKLLIAGQTIGVIHGYEYGPIIDSLMAKYASNIYQATGVSPLTNNIKMLQTGRISALLDSKYNVEYEIKMGNVTDIKYAGSEGDFVPLFLGYAPTISPEVIKSFDDGLKLLRSKAVLQDILEKYGVPDWQ